ncbi:MAG: ATP-binding protein [Lachnospiraceae bacterium]
MYIGNIQTTIINTSPNSPNNSLFITGISGSGKTCRMNRIELDAAQNGGTVIVFDLSHTHESSQMLQQIAPIYQQFENRIDILNDGINISLLKSLNGNDESFASIINTATNILSSTARLGSRQICALREAIIWAFQHQQSFPNDIDAIAHGLGLQEHDSALQVYNKLWSLFNCNAIRESSKQISPGKINILDFSKLDSLTKIILAEITLSGFWCAAKSGSLTNHRNITFVIDELQNFPLKPDSTLLQLLREGRKFNLNYILATQTTATFSPETLAALNQCAVRLYFRPAIKELRKTATEIDPSNVNYWYETLSKLKVGEFVALGNLRINSNDIHYPIIIA